MTVCITLRARIKHDFKDSSSNAWLKCPLPYCITEKTVLSISPDTLIMPADLSSWFLAWDASPPWGIPLQAHRTFPHLLHDLYTVTLSSPEASASLCPSSLLHTFIYGNIKSQDLTCCKNTLLSPAHMTQQLEWRRLVSGQELPKSQFILDVIIHKVICILILWAFLILLFSSYKSMKNGPNYQHIFLYHMAMSNKCSRNK